MNSFNSSKSVQFRQKQNRLAELNKLSEITSLNDFIGLLDNKIKSTLIFMSAACILFKKSVEVVDLINFISRQKMVDIKNTISSAVTENPDLVFVLDKIDLLVTSKVNIEQTAAQWGHVAAQWVQYKPAKKYYSSYVLLLNAIRSVSISIPTYQEVLVGMIKFYRNGVGYKENILYLLSKIQEANQKDIRAATREVVEKIELPLEIVGHILSLTELCGYYRQVCKGIRLPNTVNMRSLLTVETLSRIGTRDQFGALTFIGRMIIREVVNGENFSLIPKIPTISVISAEMISFAPMCSSVEELCGVLYRRLLFKVKGNIFKFNEKKIKLSYVNDYFLAHPAIEAFAYIIRKPNQAVSTKCIAKIASRLSTIEWLRLLPISKMVVEHRVFKIIRSIFLK